MLSFLHSSGATLPSSATDSPSAKEAVLFLKTSTGVLATPSGREYIVLPFVLFTASRVFTTCIAPTIVYLCLQGCTIYPYLDNWLVVADSEVQLEWDMERVTQLWDDLSLFINWKKSKLDPA
uniref:Uncharacterized protein n=1 Tax=Sphaerodactylus townsendi TaxID=933632 RepID=A0ACB8FQ75_9SAUR